MNFADIKQFAVRYHFWGICIFVTLVGMIAWFFAYSGLESEFTAHKSEIDSNFTNGEAASKVTNHPNEEYQTEMDKLIGLRRKDLLLAWIKMYNRQRESILKWPADRMDAELLRKVKERLGNLPIEQVKIEPADEIAPHIRGRYNIFLDNELVRLADQIQASWERKAGAPPGPPVLVNWNKTNEDAIKLKFTWPESQKFIPDTRQIVYAQEDLWVLEALIGVIARCNAGADAPHKCTVRAIEGIYFGTDAGSRLGQVFKPAVPVAEVAAGQLAPPPAAKVAEKSGQPEVPDPANNRYVNLDYKLMTADDLKTATTTPDVKTAYLAVAKRMPIRMRLVMDSRKLSKLIAECGNSALPIEIRQVRINPPQNEAVGVGGGNVGQMAPRPPGHGGIGREGAGVPPPLAPPRIQEGPRPPIGNPGQPNGQQEMDFPYDATVEIYGIVHLFNPVNPKKLGYDDEQLKEVAKDKDVEKELNGLSLLPATPAGATPAGATPAGAAPATGTNPPMGTDPAKPPVPAGPMNPVPPAGVMPPGGAAPMPAVPPAGKS